MALTGHIKGSGICVNVRARLPGYADTVDAICCFIERASHAPIDDRSGKRNICRDDEIAREAAEIMKKTSAGKAILEKVNALSDDDVDAQLRGLEPK